MICSKDFIKTYNQLFKELEKQKGKAAVTELWCICSDAWLKDLKEMAREEGVIGCMRYWMRTLTAEKADCILHLDIGKKVFQIEMKKCPSLSVLDEPYGDYCKHCDIIYRKIMESLGFNYKINFNSKGQCLIEISESRD